jgi:DNA-binding response OmpR family regulator
MASAKVLVMPAAWGPDYFGDDGVVDVHVKELRRKLEDDPRKG